MKKCSICKEIKETVSFSKMKQAGDGLRSNCKSCDAKKRILTKEKRKNYYLLYRAKNPGLAAKFCREWRKKNPGYQSPCNKKLRENKDLWNARRREWSAQNPSRVAEQASRRRAVERKATPLWANKNLIIEIFEKARKISKETGILHHVDHIVPLKSEFICGLHWEGNLQILPYYENISKFNRIISDFPILYEAIQ